LTNKNTRPFLGTQLFGDGNPCLGSKRKEELGGISLTPERYIERALSLRD